MDSFTFLRLHHYYQVTQRITGDLIEGERRPVEVDGRTRVVCVCVCMCVYVCVCVRFLTPDLKEVQPYFAQV